jgi:hypothetical protein
MTLVVIVVLIVFIVSFVTVTPFLDFVCCSASRFGRSRSYLLLVPSQARFDREDSTHRQRAGS